MVRSPEMHVVPAAWNAAMLAALVIVSVPCVRVPAQPVGWTSWPHTPAWQVAGPVVVSHTCLLPQVVPHDVVRLRSTSQAFAGSPSQFLVPEAQGIQLPTTHVWVSAVHATAVPQSPAFVHVWTALPMHCVLPRMHTPTLPVSGGPASIVVPP